MIDKEKCEKIQKFNELKAKLKFYVKDLHKIDTPTTYRIPLDNKLAIYVGWGSGFDECNDRLLHSKTQPEYCVCVKIAENKYPYLWDDVNMPWYVDTLEVFDTDRAIDSDEDYNRLASGLLGEYQYITTCLNLNTLTFGN